MGNTIPTPTPPNEDHARLVVGNAIRTLGARHVGQVLGIPPTTALSFALGRGRAATNYLVCSRVARLEAA